MKVTLKIVILCTNLLGGCKQNNNPDELHLQQSMDSIASVKIDSAYKKIQAACDSAQKYRLPILVDSLLQYDTLQ